MNFSETRDRFSSADGIELAYGLVAHVARSHGIRALMIKGPMAAEYGLRAPRPIADADVLVEPDAFEELYGLMLARGWHPRVARDSPRFIALHSRTLIHDSWPCDIDMHMYFPGFFADPERVFDVLWKDRRVRGQGAASLVIPSKAGMAAIVALHALRSPAEERSKGDIKSVVQALRGKFSAAERAEFTKLARRCRASWVLREMIIAAELDPPEDDALPEEKSVWERNQMSSPDKSAALWLDAVLSNPLLHIPKAALNAIWVPRNEIPRNDESRTPGVGEALIFQVARWRRGIVALRRGGLRRRVARMKLSEGGDAQPKEDDSLS